MKFGGNKSMLLIPPFPTRRKRKRLACKERWVLSVAIVKLVFVAYEEKITTR